MALTPEDAAVHNDAAINDAAAKIEIEIDNVLVARWHSGCSMVEIPAPEFTGKWAEQIEHVVSGRFTGAGWKIERQQQPTERWIFKRAR